MAVVYPLTLPTVSGKKRVTIYAAAAVTNKRSIFSYISQTQEFSGQQWGAEITLANMNRANAEQWECFLLKLNGQKGTFLLGTEKTPQGVASGSPVVDGAGQSGQVLNIRGLSPNIAGILKAGDYLQIGYRLYKTLNDAASDASGKAALDIWPRLRESPGDGEGVVLRNCVGLFKLAKSTYNIYALGEDLSYQLAFSAVEAI